MVSIVIIALGLAIGSFLNVCIYRIQNNQSVVAPRSFCPKCQHTLSVWENIPIFSFIILRGKCSQCHSPISKRYIIVEIITAILFYLLYLRFDSIYDIFVYGFFTCLIVIITFIDLDTKLIPNKLLLIGLIPAVYPIIKNGYHYWDNYLIGGLGLGLGFFVIGYVGKLILKEDSMGMGDVKFAALIGLMLGWQQGLLVTGIAFFSAAALILILSMIGKIGFRQKLPFAPFLSFGTIISILYGPVIIHWYLGLISF